MRTFKELMENIDDVLDVLKTKNNILWQVIRNSPKDELPSELPNDAILYFNTDCLDIVKTYYNYIPNWIRFSDMIESGNVLITKDFKLDVNNYEYTYHGR